MKFLPRSIPGVAVLVVALVLAASGGAVAAKKIDGGDIKNGSLTTKDIKDQTLAPADFSAAAKSSLAGPAGPAGPAGVKGATGPAGPGFDDFEWLEVTETVPANTDDLVAEGDCPAGKQVVGAWAFWNGHNEALQVSVNFIGDHGQAVAWSDGVDSDDDVVLQFSCASLPGPARPGSSLTTK
jgi:hypothetical protein